MIFPLCLIDSMTWFFNPKTRIVSACSYRLRPLAARVTDPATEQIMTYGAVVRL